MSNGSLYALKKVRTAAASSPRDARYGRLQIIPIPALARTLWYHRESSCVSLYTLAPLLNCRSGSCKCSAVSYADLPNVDLEPWST